MKAGNVILAIFLWLCIPAAIFFGVLGAVAGGGGEICILAPVILFILGLIALITAREDKVITVIEPKNKANRYCPNCGRAIPLDVNICPYCRKDFLAHLNENKSDSNGGKNE